jgi:hypothetical protein
MRKLLVIGALFAMVIGITTVFELSTPNAMASSHREAPLISQDPAADGTDFHVRQPGQAEHGDLYRQLLPV